jgi:hypothetical protein
MTEAGLEFGPKFGAKGLALTLRAKDAVQEMLIWRVVRTLERVGVSDCFHKSPPQREDENGTPNVRGRLGPASVAVEFHGDVSRCAASVPFRHIVVRVTVKHHVAR